MVYCLTRDIMAQAHLVMVGVDIRCGLGFTNISIDKLAKLGLLSFRFILVPF